ncbi:MAG: threonine/serine dehydratase [Gemmatimonadota bacterium]|nr:threonine/serine dehydratase [Gemmatimonadota bacterium]MDH4350682.1 threonine/serine dehydratase [Gemmatimonadota bacterium]MDH5195818.1 threonine/serine dehydratase [Gemmatimonadota bacterium]
MTHETLEAACGRVTLDAIREAAAGLIGVAVRTELTPVPALEVLAGVPVYLKLESQQPTGAFKLRGAWTAIRRLPDEARRRGVITYSSGNHGQAVAYAARRLGLRAVIVMPETAPALKVAGVRKWGGEVVLAGTTSEDRRARAMEIVAAEGLTVVPPFDHPDIIAGQGTVGLEIVEDLPDVALVAVPVGGGGLLAGITTAVRAVRPEARVTAVEPDGAPAMQASLQAGHLVRLAETHSIADGLLPVVVGELPFALVRDHVTSVTVSDAAIRDATVWLLRTCGVLAEPSGAATTAALRAGLLPAIGPTVLVVSGGNVDPAYVTRLEADLAS